MLVYDSSNSGAAGSTFECTYTTFSSNSHIATAESPILILDNSEREW